MAGALNPAPRGPPSGIGDPNRSPPQLGRQSPTPRTPGSARAHLEEMTLRLQP